MSESNERPLQPDPLRAPTDPYRDLFEHTSDAILIIEDGQFVDCNQATVEMLRCSDRQQVLQTHPSELSPPYQPDGRSSREKADEMIRTAFEQGNHRFEWHHRRADGEVFPVEVLLTAVEKQSKRFLHVVWRDITERKQLEERYRLAQKMEAVGLLAGGIAHDFNNLLVAIVGHSELLELSLSMRPDLLEQVAEIRKAGERASTLVRQLLAFSRKQKVQPKVIELNSIISEVEKMLSRLIGENVHLEVQLDQHPLPVLADSGQIEQVVVNLVTNARDAMPEGGTIRLMLSKIAPSEPAPQGLPPGSYARLAVSDTGSGMDGQTLSHAFDPFFTTKEVGHGTGLGLSTTLGIVQQAKGTVGIHSQVGSGTTIEIVLPLSVENPSHERTNNRGTAEGGDETILVVEDEPAVSTLVETVLCSKGYTVLFASDGLEALRIWDEAGADIDLVLTDLVMPNMGGVELVESLRQRGYEPRVVFTTGYTTYSTDHLLALSPDEVLEKPYSGATLARRVRQALDRD